MIEIESERISENRIEVSDQKDNISWIFEERENSLSLSEIQQNDNSFSGDQIDIRNVDLKIIREAESLSEFEV
jgi:hypothetical protein